MADNRSLAMRLLAPIITVIGTTRPFGATCTATEFSAISLVTVYDVTGRGG